MLLSFDKSRTQDKIINVYMTSANNTWDKADSSFVNPFTWSTLTLYTTRPGSLHWLFAASTGGLLGLCLGFSGLSLMEVLYFLTLRLWCRRRRKRQIVTKIANKLLGLWRRGKGKEMAKKGDNKTTFVMNGWENERIVNESQGDVYYTKVPANNKGKGIKFMGNAKSGGGKIESNVTDSPFFIITHELQQMERNLRGRSNDLLRPPGQFQKNFW